MSASLIIRVLKKHQNNKSYKYNNLWQINQMINLSSQMINLGLF